MSAAAALAAAAQPRPEQAPLQRWPFFEDDEIEAARAVLASGRVNYWTGEEGRHFEREFAHACGVAHGIALANGTQALELALRALALAPGDEVVVTPRSFVASASAVVSCGGVPVFADVDACSQTLTAATIEPVLTPHTRAVIAVHLAGWPCPMDEIVSLARKHGLAVIEDCAQAHGARLHGRPVGSWGDIAAFSFCQDKIMTTGGEGGMLVTDDETLWRRAWSLKDHGKDWDLVHHNAHPPGFRWLHTGFGTNARMSEMQAAIGRRQLRKLPRWLTLRRRNAAILRAVLDDVAGLRIPAPPPSVEHACYKFYAFVRPERLRPGWSRDRIIARMNEEGHACFQGSCAEIYREAAFREAGLGPEEPLPAARMLGQTSLMLLVDPSHGEARMTAMAQSLRSIMEEAAW